MQYPRPGFLDQPPTIILVLLLFLLICILAPLRAHAQEATWPGTVEGSDAGAFEILLEATHREDTDDGEWRDGIEFRLRAHW